MEYVSRLDLCKYYSLYGNMWKLILQSRTLLLVFTIFYEGLGGGTRLAMPNNMRAGLIVIKAWFRGY